MTTRAMMCGLLLLTVPCMATRLPAGPPDWTVNESEYQYNGSVTSAVYRDLVDVGSAGDMVGAFAGEECRGVIEAWLTPGSNYVFPITVFSNQASGESLSFRYYDSAIDAVRGIEERVEFVSDMTMGSLYAPVPMHAGRCWPFIPENPVPCHSCLEDTVETLSWEGGDADAGDSVIYYVYLGMETDPPLYDSTEVYEGSTTGIEYEITPPLTVFGIYYWKIVAEDRQGMSTAGPTWTFNNTSGATEPTHWGRIKMLFE